MTDRPEPGLLAAADWYGSLPPPVLASPRENGRRLNLRRYVGTPARMEQPGLVENLLCLHLGGSKQVRRWHEGRMSLHDVDMGALSLVPAQQTNSWLTHGPVDFGLIALGPDLLRQAAVEEFDFEPQRCCLQDAVGFRSPGIERLFQAMLGAAARPSAAGRLYPESLLVVLTVALLRDHSAYTADKPGRLVPGPPKGGLSQWRLRRVTDYMAANLQADIDLATLVEQVSLSRAQFFRAFKQSTGLSPHRYLASLRLEKARSLLDTPGLSVEEVGAAVGLGPERRFTALFRSRFGLTPLRYRLARG